MISLFIKQRLTLFKNRNYAFFCLSGLFATFAGALVFVAMSAYAFTTQGIVGTVSIFIGWTAPAIVLAPFIGAIADRYSKRNLLIISTLVRGSAILLFVLAVNYHIAVAIVFLALIQGTFNAIYSPAAIPLIYSIVDERHLLAANATIDIVYEVVFIIGLASSGIILLYVDSHHLMMIGAIFMFCAAILLFLLKTNTSVGNSNTIPLMQPNSTKQDKFSPWQDYKSAIDYLRSHRFLFIPYGTQTVIRVLMMCIATLLMPYVVDVLKQNTAVFAKFEIALSIGVIVGGVLSPMIAKKIGENQTLALYLILLMLGLSIMAVTQQWQFAIVAYSCVGVGFASWALAVTASQKQCENSYHGRMQATFEALSGLFILLISLLLIIFEKAVSIRMMYVIFAAVSFLTFLMVFIQGYRQYKSISHD
ncbi:MULTISPECIES: MFS transporter [unclassified Acinetobacter]|uniref:MFS transporter n=1 Tax=unclassified Acinetobacter TaxID=196816 RepID=UPI0035BA9C7D